MNDQLKKILAPVASLRLTVVLLALSMVLIFAGTTIQNELGIWDVQRIYFHSWFCLVEWRLFFPLWEWGNKKIPGAIPFPGGYTLIVALLLNLLAAHAIRFKVSWKRSGILLIHAGMVLLIIGEMITAETQREGQMILDVGSSSNFTQDIREAELAIVDPSPTDHDAEIVVPVGRLMQKGTVQHEKLPFTVKLDEYYPNSTVKGPREPGPHDARATVGPGVGITLLPMSKFTGTEASSVDFPSAYVTVGGGDEKTKGTYLLSTIELGGPFPQINAPQSVKVGDKEYWLQLRFRREYRPFTVHLHKFSHDKYEGTDVARNFSSLISLTDPSQNVDREVLIWMNHPLRYAGETFYQSSFKPGDQTSILLVVRNPGWLIPYISCTMVGIGLLVHFGMHLVQFLSRYKQTVPVPGDLDDAEPAGVPVTARGNGASKRNGKHSTAVLERPKASPRPAVLPLARRSASPIPAVLASVFCILYLVAGVFPGKSSGAFDLDLFARVPVSYDGRTMPLDSLARNSLRIMSGRSELRLGDDTRPAISWLMDVFSQPNKAATYAVFRIDHPDIKGILGLDDSRKHFSFDELEKGIQKLQQQYSMAQNTPANKRDLYQRKILELGRQILLFNRLAGADTLLLSPPLAAKEWRTLGTATDTKAGIRQSDPGAAAFLTMVQAKTEVQPSEYRSAGTAYQDLLMEKLPGMAKRLDVEVVFNQAQPFYRCMVLYVIGFLMAAGSWLVWRGPLSRAAFWVLVIALVFHTLGLVARVYLQGRPPVTNLYSSAIFIAWAVVLFCVCLEPIFRNAVATAAACAVAFPSLLIAHFLSGSGDTMQMLQAVLDTNFWLATHVVVITMGYAATFLAGMIAIGYVLFEVFKGLAPETRKTLYRMVYGVICFAMLFSFVGTILGGIWADQSWGRFWGWDPKENGAVLIVLWNAIILHARWGGLVKERGFMNLAIFGNIVTSWSWFGTNMLGVGLHSYGFMDSALVTLLTFIGSQLAIILVGWLHPKYLGGLRDPRGFEVRPA